MEENVKVNAKYLGNFLYPIPLTIQIQVHQSYPTYNQDSDPSILG